MAEREAVALSTLTDAWPVLAGVTSGPAIFFALYRWVVRQLLTQIKLLTEQRNSADGRSTAVLTELDALQDKYDLEKNMRREAEDKVFSLTRVTAERDALLVENTRLRGATP